MADETEPNEPEKPRRKRKSRAAAEPPPEVQAEVPADKPAQDSGDTQVADSQPTPADSAIDGPLSETPAEPAPDAPPAEEPAASAETPSDDSVSTTETPAEDAAAEAPAVIAEETGENVNESTPETPAATEEPEVPALSFEDLCRTLEALLFAAEEPLAPRELARASGSDSATVRKALKAITDQYNLENRPWELIEVAQGFRLHTRPEFFPAIQRLKTQTAQRKLTQAALETLAVIAYRQPIGRAEIENVRGVGAGPVLRQLLERKLIQIAGRGTGLGQPLLYGTTPYFLEHFGLKSVNDLPKAGEFKNT